MRITAHSWARPIRIATTCGPGGSVTTASAAARSSTTRRSATTGPRIRSGCRGRAFPGRSIRTSASASTGRDSGDGRKTRISATTATIRCCISISIRTRSRARLCSRGRATARTSPFPARRSTRCSPRYAMTSATIVCPRCRGLWHPRRFRSTATGRRTTAPGISRRRSMR